LGFGPSTKEQLDNWLLQAFQRNLPAHFNLLANHQTPFAAAVHAHKHSKSTEIQRKLLTRCLQVMRSSHAAPLRRQVRLREAGPPAARLPGADIALRHQERPRHDPRELADSNGHPELAATLCGYMNMNEFTNMYAKLKEMSLAAKTPQDDDCYVTPKTMEEFYKVCPRRAR
jgi:phosphoinositide 3-kinase adaptor protein 1